MNKLDKLTKASAQLHNCKASGFDQLVGLVQVVQQFSSCWFPSSQQKISKNEISQKPIWGEGHLPSSSPQPAPSFTLVAPSIGHGFLGLGFFLGVKWVSDTLMFLGFHETLKTVSLPVITPLYTPPWPWPSNDTELTLDPVNRVLITGSTPSLVWWVANGCGCGHRYPF